VSGAASGYFRARDRRSRVDLPRYCSSLLLVLLNIQCPTRSAVDPDHKEEREGEAVGEGGEGAAAEEAGGWACGGRRGGE